MIGLGSYAFFWQHSSRVEDPLSLTGAFERTREAGVDLFQICDYDPLLSMSHAEIIDAARTARELGLSIELGTKGLDPEHLQLFLGIADQFEASLVRSMVPAAVAQVGLAHVENVLRPTLSAYRAAGVTLALETYEQFATESLVAVVESIGSDYLGICLDPANVVAALETPRHAVEVSAELTRNVHAKDFSFDRQEGWVGFTYSGAPLGQGQHDYAHLMSTVRPRDRGINEIVEHWLPWQGNPVATLHAEQAWTRTALDYLRSF